MCRHSLGQAFPTRECMTLLLGIRFSGQSSAVEHVRLLIGDAVESVSEMIRRYGKLGSKRNVLLSDSHGARVVRHVVRPLHEVMTLCRRCGERQRSALSQTTATLVNRSALSSRDSHVMINHNLDLVRRRRITKACVGREREVDILDILHLTR